MWLMSTSNAICRIKLAMSLSASLRTGHAGKMLFHEWNSVKTLINIDLRYN